MTWEVVDDHAIRDILKSVPAAVFQNERWFSEKLNQGNLQLVDFLSFSRATGDEVICLNLYKSETGSDDRFYFIPLLIIREPRPTPHWFVKENYYCYDGIPTLEYISLIFQCFQAKSSFSAGYGSFSFYTFRELPWAQFKIHGSSSNSLLFISSGMLAKNYRLVFEGIHPELEVGIALAESASAQIPEIYGHLQYRSGQNNYALVLIQEVVENEGTAWEVWKDLILERTSSVELMADASSLGGILAKLHLELEQMSRKLGQSRTLEGERLEDKIDALERIIRNDLMVYLKDTAELALEKLCVLRKTITGTHWGLRFRIHGDLHLEQVLKTVSGWKFIDFEGEPFKSIAERGNFDSPLKDVASLLRSVSYRVHSLDPIAPPGCEAELQQRIISGYLDTYREHDGQFLPAPFIIDKLLELFQLERVIYEYTYELKYRPDWIRIPEAGLKKLLEKA